MVFFKRSFFCIAALLMLMIMSSCGSSSDNNANTANVQNTPTPTATATDTPTPAVSPTASAADVIKTATATVGGKPETILTDAKGMTLYYFKPDTSTKATCTGTCAQTWRPLLFNEMSMGTATATTTTTMTATTTTKTATAAATTTTATLLPSNLPGEVKVAKTANGNQVFYNGHPLYTYSGDTAAGQTKGEGIGGNWFVATSTIAKNV